MITFKCTVVIVQVLCTLLVTQFELPRLINNYSFKAAYNEAEWQKKTEILQLNQYLNNNLPLQSPTVACL